MSDSPTGTPAGTPSDTEEVPPPPCRAAELYLVSCPHCGRRMRIKTLRYSHLCGRNFNVQLRAEEQQMAAEAAINTRMRRLEQAPTPRVEHTAAVVPLRANKRDYASLLNF